MADVDAEAAERAAKAARAKEKVRSLRAIRYAELGLIDISTRTVFNDLAAIRSQTSKSSRNFRQRRQKSLLLVLVLPWLPLGARLLLPKLLCRQS